MLFRSLSLLIKIAFLLIIQKNIAKNIANNALRFERISTVEIWQLHYQKQTNEILEFEIMILKLKFDISK